MRWIALLLLVLLVGCAPANNNEHKGHTDGKKILFYRNPMNPQITSPVPMKDEMGMDYVPVYAVPAGRQEQEKGAEGEITVTPEEQKLIEVETAGVSFRNLFREIRTVGNIASDPELYVAQEEYLGALKLQDNDFIESGRKKLEILGLNAEQIDQLAKAGKPQGSLILPEDTTWVYITIYENEIGVVKAGVPVEVETVAFPGEMFAGRIAAVSPVLDPMTRSAKARAEIKNPGQKLKPGMYANVTIKVSLGNKLAVADSAVINTGKRTIVVIDKGEGRYLSQDIRLGQKGEGYYEVLGGLKAGDRVVTTGNFLIDSESRLKSVSPGEHQH